MRSKSSAFTVREGQVGRPSNRAWVKNPVWATIRWSGRTDWPSMCQPRFNTSVVSAMPKRDGGQLFTELRGLQDRRRVGHEQTTGPQRVHSVLDDLPGLRQVEHDAIEVDLVDPLVAVALLDAVTVEHLRAEEGLDVLAGAGGEVGTQLVADDLCAGAQQRHRERPRANPRLEHPGAREHIGQEQERAEVLGVDDLRAARHLEHEVRQRRPDHRVAAALARAVRGALLGPDEQVVVEDARVRVELLA